MVIVLLENLLLKSTVCRADNFINLLHCLFVGGVRGWCWCVQGVCVGAVGLEVSGLCRGRTSGILLTFFC
jgi:hypothetical protein